MERMDERDASALAATLTQDEANRRSMFQWAHPSWYSGVLADTGAADSPAWAGYAPRWLELVGFAPLPLQAFQGRAALLASLPIPSTIRILRLRAIWPRRAELRHWIDRPRRMRLVSSVGAAAAEALRRDSASALGGAGWLEKSPALDAMSDEALAWDGYCFFECDGVWADTAWLPLVRAALPRTAKAATWIERYRQATDPDDSAAVFGYLPLIRPENG